MKHSLHSLWARLATPTPRGQRGIALLLTLGVLSLLLVLAMSFAYTARTERQAAGNNADLVKARLLAESGLERAMVGLRAACSPGSYATTEQRLYPGTNGNFFSSPTSSADWTGRRYMFSVGSDTTDIAGGLASSLATSSSSYSFTPSSNALGAGWIDILDTSSTSGSPIIGRVSYVVIDQGGMIDPGAVASATTPVRVGADPTEIQLSNLSSPANTAAAGFLNNMPSGKRWFSMDHIVRGNTASQNQFDIFRQTLFPWSYDTDNYRLTPTSTEQTRYSLANTSSATVATLTSSIPWLANLSPASVRDQVAANLIDYCDSNDNDIATVPAGFTFLNTAAYVGLEKVPYINEIVITGKLNTIPGPPISYTLDLTANVEVVDIYNVSKPAAFKMDVTFSNTDWHISGSGNIISADYNIDHYAETGNYFSPTYALSGSSASLSVKKIAVILSNSSTSYESTVMDYVLLEPSLSPSVSLTPSNSTQCISFQVKDPRSNTSYTGNWDNAGWSATVSVLGTANGTNADPSGKYPDGDVETTHDPALNLSTAYIRNGNMLSLWELGAIHRGEPWRTLNLSTTTTGALSYTYTAGDANILDQVTLSTTTTSTAPIRGRFNANSPQAEAWACFLAGVTAGATYDAPESGTALTNGGASGGDSKNSYKLGEKICEVNGATSGSVPFANRGGIALCTEWTNSDSAIISPKPTTDRAREEIIGKIAGLLTVRSNYFTVIVTAQAVKDMSALGNAPATMPNRPSSWVNYDSTNNYWCNVLAEQKILAVVSRDAFTNKFVIESFEYLDE